MAHAFDCTQNSGIEVIRDADLPLARARYGLGDRPLGR